ncbi:MAG: hypothetical protein AAGF23_25965, partial [Acidobacteriota bacterium]
SRQISALASEASKDQEPGRDHQQPEKSTPGALNRLVGELADVEQILKLLQVDRTSIRLQFKRHGFEDLFQQLIERLPDR